MRRNLIALFLCLAVTAPAFILQTPSALAAKRPLECKELKARTSPTNPTKQAFRYCTGMVLSKDGTSLLDTSVTMPAKGKGPFPLVVILHGLTQTKKSYESHPSEADAEHPDRGTVEGVGSKYHYNNLWFASKGYMVLTYTARGWKVFEGMDFSNVISQSKCKKTTPQSVDGLPDDMYPGIEPACYIQIAHLKYEIADTQYLIGRLVDGTLTNALGVKAIRKKIGVTGVSYGAGQSWTLTRKNQWRSPKGTRIRIDAAAPIIGWTDILDALMPNGRRSDTETRQSLADRKDEPVGVKNDYVDVFYTGVKSYATAGYTQVVDYLKKWKARIDAGEPYAGDPLIADAFHKLLTKRSAFFIPKKTQFDTPIFAAQAFTDGIFPAIQSIKMANRLQAEREDKGQKRYPISLYLGDWGHSPSQSKQDEFEYIADRVNEWFRFYVKNSGDKPANNTEARMTVCDGSDGVLGDLYRSRDWANLGEMTPLLAGAGAQVSTPADDPHAYTLVPNDGARDHPGQEKDPDGNPQEGFNGVPDASCRTTDTVVDDDNYAMTSAPLPADLRMLGLPQVTFEADPTQEGADPAHEEMYVAARLWDVDPGELPVEDDDTQTLVTRGVYRLDGLDPQAVDFKLFGNAYTFAQGHSVKIELTADDSPSFQLWDRDPNGSGTPGSIDIISPSLSLPVANCAKRVGGCDLTAP